MKFKDLLAAVKDEKSEHLNSRVKGLVKTAITGIDLRVQWISHREKQITELNDLIEQIEILYDSNSLTDKALNIIGDKITEIMKATEIKNDKK